MDHPYQSLPAEAFWSGSVARKAPLEIGGVWIPKNPLAKTDKISTAGSCFAQHIGKALAARGYHWFDGEPPPIVASEALRRDYGFGIFSFRTGNIYTTALLEQWVAWAIGERKPPDEIFHNGGACFDPFRPAIEPGGFADVEELLASRDATLKAILRVLAQSDVLVFTLGLTESWIHAKQGHVYPMCPGTVAGEFSPEDHVFVNYDYAAVRASMERFFEMALSVNPKLRFLLTVSPVPLTATASGQHVLTATTYSKSTLRAVAGDLAQRPDVDYFPSYELISSFPFRGMFYEDNLRSVKPDGVGFVMDTFFDCLHARFPDEVSPPMETTAPPAAARADSPPPMDEDLVCEDVLLDAFSRKEGA